MTLDEPVSLVWPVLRRHGVSGGSIGITHSQGRLGSPICVAWLVRR
jgi:hypothetical protein